MLYGTHNEVRLTSKAHFMAIGQSIRVKIMGEWFTAEPRTFSTGSVGWYVNGKCDPEMDAPYVDADVYDAQGNHIALFDAAAKEKSSGKTGWYYGGKCYLPVSTGSVRVQVGYNVTIGRDGRGQIGINLTVVRSKDLPESASAVA